MIMIVISFGLVKFYAFAILYVFIVMRIKFVVVVVDLNLARYVPWDRVWFLRFSVLK